jgi:hypothetical protein
VLAYVFSHRLSDGAGASVYEDGLRRFHAALAAAPPQGFRSSVTYRIADGYSDWYLVDDSAALDRLNEAAVSGDTQQSHDQVALMSTDGAGKLLTLVSGEPRCEPGFEVRFSRPRGLAYRDLYKQLEPWCARQGVSLWRRMMVLGPPPEFCLISPTGLDLPTEMDPVTLRRSPV